MRNIIGWRKCKGITLIETIAYISISTIIISLAASLFITAIRHQSTLNKDSWDISYTDNVEGDIKKIIMDNDNEKYFIYNNKLIIQKKKIDGEDLVVENHVVRKYKEIMLSNNKIVVNTYSNWSDGRYYKDNMNTIADKIDNMQVVRKDNLIYMTIKNQQWGEVLICI